MYFSQFWRLEVQAQVASMAEGRLACRSRTSHCSEKGRGLSLGENANPIHDKHSTLKNCKQLPRPRLLKLSPLRVRISTCDFQGDTNIQTMAQGLPLELLHQRESWRSDPRKGMVGGHPGLWGGSYLPTGREVFQYFNSRYSCIGVFLQDVQI